MTTIQADQRAPSPSPSQLPPIPASPTYSYASTANPATPAAGEPGSSIPNMTMNMNLSSYTLPLPPPPPPTAPHAVLTKSDLAASQAAYSELLTTAKSYRVALATLSTAASAFGAALEACARLKEARADSLTLGSNAPPPTATTSGACTADALLSAAGVQHLIANHDHILSETVYRSFEVPLLHELDKWRRDVDDEEASYRAAVKSQSADIRRLEKEGMRLHRQRGPRDVAKFRGHLVELTTKLDGLTALHGEHARTLLRESQDTSVKILESSCSLVRAEVDIFESLARKGWSGGGLDEILEKGTDLFAATSAADEAVDSEAGAKLFSILPPRSILADTASTDEATRGRGGGYPGHHERADSLGVASEPYQSLIGAVGSGGSGSPRRPLQGHRQKGSIDLDASSIFSADFTSTGRPRMTRPFSPKPVRVRPEDVMREDHDERLGQEREDVSDDGEPSSPETIRDDEAEVFRRSTDLGLSGEEDEHPWDDVNKRMSTAASDPEERERRWKTGEEDD